MAIQIDSLSFSYGREPILEGINFSIEKGKWIGIIGPNGGGKTTLLKLLMGFLKPSKGEIRVNGKIGYVPQVQQTDREFPITLKELILLGSLAKWNPFQGYPKEVLEKADFLIDQLGLFPHKNKAFGSLSGGLAQRALFARALIGDPDLLFLDEPTANIDSASTKAIFQFLEEIKGQKTILLVTHDLKTVVQRVDTLISVHKTIEIFRPEEICEHFALGLYHTPLIDLPSNHFQKEEDHVCRTFH